MTLAKFKRNLNLGGFFKFNGWLATKSFRFFEKYFRVHFTPANYYSPVPSVRTLGPAVFEKIYDCKGVNWSVDQQLHYLTQTFSKYRNEYTPVDNSGLSLVDAFILYAMIREKKPRHFVEVGAGDTTYISLQALERNRQEGFDFTFTCVEPFPRTDIPKIQRQGFELVQKNLQEIELSFFQNVDLLFIDSSHVSKINSDVNYEILEILPSLKKGAIIHWHDIAMPQNYWKDWMETGTMFWNESYLLHAFLLFNNAFKVIWASNYMRLTHFNEIKVAFPYFSREHRLSSFWLERVADS